ncbi:SLC26A/SulP transporter family protein [Methyloversatilis thermotolerans]|uniref:SLC26A/SulP transporter family protein n=1 Tax=Methyloversatilis thermotolerans TaxID=1346290 RepID=UPI00039F389A|nr:SulP family inorganic anion transporter [Methyloversatilis thermotolerans]
MTPPSAWITALDLMTDSQPDEQPARPVKRWLREIAAGLTVATTSIPNELSYGLLAFAALGSAHEGHGMLAAMLAGMLGAAAAQIAGCRTGQIHGARPALALIVAGLISQVNASPASLPGLAAGTSALLAVTLAVAGAALLQIVAALAGWARFVRFVPYPVQAGFFNGVAILMMAGGLKLVFVEHGHWMLTPGLLAVTAVVVLPGLLLPRRWPAWPVLPALLAISAALHHALAAAGMDAGRMLGSPAGASLSFEPLTHLPAILGADGDWLRSVAGASVAIALVSSLETLFAASRLDGLTHVRHDTRRELAAVGIANLALAPAGGLPAAAAVSRATTAFAAGARTRVPALVYVCVLMLLWLCGGGLLELIPRATVGASLILLSIGVIDRWSVQALLECRVGRSFPDRRLMSNLAISALVTLVAVLVGLLEAVAAGLIGAMFLFARDHSRSVLRQVVDGSVAASLQMRPLWQQLRLTAQAHRYALIELEGLLFFGTAEELEEAIETRVPRARYIVLDCSRLVDIDLSAAQVLQRMAHRLRTRRTRLVIAGLDPEGPRGVFLARSGLKRVLPAGSWFPNADAALEWVENQVLESQSATRRLEDTSSLHRLDLCAGMTREQAQRLGSLMKPGAFARGQTLFRAGEDSDAMYVLLAGSVSIMRSENGGSAVRVACISAGLTVGEMGLIENKARAADAIADTTVEALVLDRAALERLQRDAPDIAATLYANLARTLAQRLRDTTVRLHTYMRPV